MKLSPEQLDQRTKKQLLPIYLVSGEEILLVQEACDIIRRNCRQAGFNGSVVFHAEANFDWNQLLTENAALSLFAERKLIELRLKGKPEKAGSAALIEYAQHASPDNMLLIITGKLDAASQQSQWYQALDRIGGMVTIWPVDADKLPQWIAQRLQQAGLQMHPDGIRLLAERVEGNLLAAAQEIAKLQLLDLNTAIDADTVAGIIADNARYDVFRFTNKVLAGDTAAGLRMLGSLQAEGVDPLALLGILGREIRTLAKIASRVAQGVTVDSALQQEAVWERHKPLLKAALSRLSLDDLENLLQQASEIDRSVKGMSDGRVWEKLQELVMCLSGKRLRLANLLV